MSLLLTMQLHGVHASVNPGTVNCNEYHIRQLTLASSLETQLTQTC